ncbi:MAG: glycosyltransferase [Patescibacteria group bacterium]
MAEKILFVGDLNEYGRCLQRYKTLIDLGHILEGISTVPVPWRPITDSGLIEKITWKFKMPIDIAGANGKIKEVLKKIKYDVVWIEKGNTIRPGTLRFIKKNQPQAKLISVSEDDMYAKHNHSLYYVYGLKYYDIVFTTKTYNLTELKSLGAKKTELFLDAYDEKLHRPYVLSEEEKKRFSCDVSSIGAFEEDRAMKMLYLAERGIKIVIWGNSWKSWVGKHSNLIVKNEHLFKEDYSKAINATKINLCFLRKINRDEVTSRSVEIPACGGFMIAEKTKRHLEFFKENKEAVFFETNEELYDLIKKYLADEPARKKIAEAGRQRVIKSGYNHRVQLKKMLSII